MTCNTTNFVGSCAYCRLANATSHKAQSNSQAIKTQEPFNLIFLDVWTPGDFPAKWGAIKALTCIKGMNSFAEAALIVKADSKTIAQAAFSSLFMPNGLPKLVVIEGGSKFGGALTEICAPA